jgi:hypothetical protein
VSAAGPQSRWVRIDGGGQPSGLKGDGLRVHYVADGATAISVPTGPRAGKVTVNYGPVYFGVVYEDMEEVDLIPG